MKHPALRPTLAGFNSSKRCNRSSASAFIDSYIERFPDRRLWIEANLDEALGIAAEFIAHKPVLEREQVKSKLAKKDWVPRERWIPDNPSPRASYKWEATNIARHMREQLEREGYS